MYGKEVVIVVLILFLGVTVVYWQQESAAYEESVSLLQQEARSKAGELALVHQRLAELERQAAIPVVVEKPTVIEKIVEREVTPVVKSRRMPILAFSRVTQKGVVGHVEVSLIPGKGDTLIDIRPFNAPAVQLSSRNAVDAALKLAKLRQLRDKDIKIEFTIDAQAVGGESAGIAIGLATLALLLDKELKSYVAATGTIDSEGNIGKVGGILQKAEAVSKKGATMLLIPRGEGEITALTPHYIVDPNTGKILREEAPVLRKINVIKEARSRWNLNVQQVATLAEAKTYALQD